MRESITLVLLYGESRRPSWARHSNTTAASRRPDVRRQECRADALLDDPAPKNSEHDRGQALDSPSDDEVNTTVQWTIVKRELSREVDSRLPENKNRSPSR
jgi:hypothetical protein